MKSFKALYAVLAVAVISVVFITAGVSFADLNQGLVAYYPFNGNANDESGNGNNGTVNGATLTADRFENPNSAYSFDGINDYLNVPDSNSLRPANAVTVSAWVNPLDVKKVGIWNIAVTKRFAESLSPFNSYILGSSWEGEGLFCISTNNTQTCTKTSEVIVLNKWTHIAGVYDGVSIKLFVNGILKSQTPKTGNIDYSQLSLRIGRAIENQSFKGSIDDVRIYNRALSDCEVLQLYDPVASQKGFLQVTIAPQDVIGSAQWCVNGTCYNSGAKAELSAGTYTVEFKDVTGWTKPVNQSVTITNCQTQTLTGTYTKNEKGFLQVTITPAEAITAGAKWCVNSTCYNSGDKVELSPGTYTVEYKTLSCWNKPVNQSVTITSGQTSSLTGAYTQQKGFLQVTITPQEAITAGAQWTIAGSGVWKNSGDKAELTPGTYNIEYKTLSCWTKPANQSITVTCGQTAAATGAYTAQKSFLQVTITPQEAITAGAQWAVGTSGWKNSGEKVELAAGTYTLEFKNLTDWTRPATQTVTITCGETKTATGTYTKISGSSGFLTIDDATGSPGAKDVSVVISLDNSKLTTPVAAFELRIKYNALIGIHANTKYTLTSRTTGFTGSVTVTENGENSEAHILLYNTSGGTVPSGTGAIFNLLFDVDSAATIGKTSNLSFTECLVSDSAGKQIPSDCSDTAIFTIGSSCEPIGDINKDGKYNIFDLQLLINCILAKGSCDCCDLNTDTKYNIFDIQTLINKILNPTAARSREVRSASNTLTFPNLGLEPNDTGTLGLNLVNQDAVSAAQIEFIYDSTIGFEITEAKLTDRSQGFTVSMTPDKTDPKNVKAVILLYNMSGGVISAGSGDILELAYNTTAGSGTTALSFTETLLSDKNATPLSVTPQNGTVSFDGGCPTLGDVNGDGKLDLQDAVYILQVITRIR